MNNDKIDTIRCKEIPQDTLGLIENSLGRSNLDGGTSQEEDSEFVGESAVVHWMEEKFLYSLSQIRSTVTTQTGTNSPGHRGMHRTEGVKAPL